MTPATTTHILIDDRGVAWIDDTNIKVVEVALEQIAHGFSAEKIHEEHQGYLSRAQIHSALAWYFDHKDEMDAEIQRQIQDFDQKRAQSLDSPGRERLRQMGKLS